MIHVLPPGARPCDVSRAIFGHPNAQSTPPAGPNETATQESIHMTSNTQFRPRRSCLYMPGANPRALEKAKSLGADMLILDLEDAVAPEAKAEARQVILDAVNERAYGSREVVIRINGLDTQWGDRKSTRLNSSHDQISYAVFCLKKKSLTL